MNQIKKQLFTLIRICLAFGLIYYLASSGKINWSSLSGLTQKWHYTLFSAVLFFTATVIQSLRLQILINAYHLNLTFFSSVRLTFIGLFFNTYLPGATGGDLAKIYYASKGNPGHRAEVITIVIIDRFIGLISLLALPVLLVPFFTDIISSEEILQGLLVTAVTILVIIIVASYMVAKFDTTKSRLPDFIENKIIFGGSIRRILATAYSYRNHKSIIIHAILLSLASHLLMAVACMFISEVISPDGADYRMLILIPFSFFANTLPVTPGGLGVGEATMESLFNLFQIQGGVETFIGWRIIMVIVGLLGLIFYLKGEKRFIFKKSEIEQK